MWKIISDILIITITAINNILINIITSSSISQSWFNNERKKKGRNSVVHLQARPHTNNHSASPPPTPAPTRAVPKRIFIAIISGGGDEPGEQRRPSYTQGIDISSSAKPRPWLPMRPGYKAHEYTIGTSGRRLTRGRMGVGRASPERERRPYRRGWLAFLLPRRPQGECIDRSKCMRW